MKQDVLFPDHASRVRVENHLTTLLAESRSTRDDRPVVPDGDLAGFRRALSEFDFATENDLTELLDWTVGALGSGMVQMTHPRYLGLFNPAPAFAAECADRIASAFNPQLAVWSHAAVCVEIEAHVIRSVCSRAGLSPEAGGHFTSGGTEANYTAVICALTRANPEFSSKGARAFDGAPVFYVSAESHLAWLKIAHQAGLGRDAVRLVPTDGTGRMHTATLLETITADTAAGFVPLMVAATAGTTNAGMIDPLRECAQIASDHGLWFHVDAAWAGAMIASPALSPALDGIAAADSVTIDAHKWFATTMGCGIFLTAHPSVLSDTFRVSASYMPSNLESIDPYVNSVQWSRRFLGLRMFLTLASVGWNGYARHVEHSVELVEGLADTMQHRGWGVANSTSAGVLCLMPPTGTRSAADVVGRVVESGQAWVSVATLEGQQVVRVCVTNGMTDRGDMDAVAALLERAAG